MWGRLRANSPFRHFTARWVQFSAVQVFRLRFEAETDLSNVARAQIRSQHTKTQRDTF